MRAALGAVLLVIAGTAAAHACALDQVPSISLDGRLAIANKQVPTTASQLARWAPFVFRLHPPSGLAVRLSEDRGEVSRSLTRASMSHPALWRFGDGQTGLGWSVRHVYRTGGTYRITVLAYDRRSHRWYPFDQAIITVRRR